MIREITRQELIDAIEAGIENATNVLTDAEKALLRHVGRTEKHVLLSAWQQYVKDIGLCGCPLTQAGIIEIEGWNAPPEEQSMKYRRFWYAFDQHTKPMRQGSVWCVLRIRD